jgi:Zn-dependent peptidase ImmA (M78 family)/transcriptional regulator with XRE-family HTH domain
MSVEKSLHYCYQHLDYTRITSARERRGLTKKGLAELLDKKPSAITQFESGKSGLSFETFERLVEALDVPAVYLTDLINTPVLHMEACHFRANRSVSQSDRYRAIRFAQDVVALYDMLEQQYGISFPSMKFEPHVGPRPTERQIEQFSVYVRSKIGLGLGPILNMADLLESIGIRIVLLPTECAVLDAFATWVDDHPCIMIAADSPASRMQFDYAHEFAHLLLDEDNPSGDPLVERLANRFASSFLMPQPTFSPDCPRRYNLEQFLSVKKFWHVSMKAAIYRAKQLGIMLERQYINAFISMARQGISKDEPGEFDPPLPTMLEQALEMISHEATLDSLADGIGLKTTQLLELLAVQKISPALVKKLTPKPASSKVLTFVRR